MALQQIAGQQRDQGHDAARTGQQTIGARAQQAAAHEQVSAHMRSTRHSQRELYYRQCGRRRRMAAQLLGKSQRWQRKWTTREITQPYTSTPARSTQDECRRGCAVVCRPFSLHPCVGHPSLGIVSSAAQDGGSMIQRVTGQRIDKLGVTAGSNTGFGRALTTPLLQLLGVANTKQIDAETVSKGQGGRRDGNYWWATHGGQRQERWAGVGCRTSNAE